MILRYVGVKQYNDINMEININLGGRFVFQYRGNKIEIIEEQEYVSSNYLYRGRNISEISAIIGRNGSGKTTVLKIISKVVSGKYKNYILIEENENNGFLIYSDMQLDTSQAEELLRKRGYYLKLCNRVTKAKVDSVYQIYFSNIFDKSKPLEESINLCDISTNYEIKKYIENHYKNYEHFTDVADSVGEEVIDSFRHSEIDKKMDLALAIKEEYLKDKNKMLFTLPEYIKIYLSDNIHLKNKISGVIRKELDDNDKNEFNKICTNIDAFLGKTFRTEDEFENHFIVYIMHEIILEFLRKEICSLRILVKVLNMVAKKEKWVIIENILGNNENYINNINDSKKDNKLAKEVKKQEPLEMAYYNVIKIIERIEEQEAYLEKGDLYEINDDIYEVANLIYDSNSSNMQECLERIEEEIEEILRDYTELEIEEVQEEIERLDNMLEDLRILLLDERNTKISFLVGGSTEMFSEIDEFQNVEENILDIYENINEKFILIKTLKRILDKESTRVYSGVDTFVKVRLKDEDVIIFYEEYKKMHYQTFKLIIDHEDLSSGQNAYLDMCARLYHCSRMPRLEDANHILLFLDEGEMYLHPQMQVKYIENLIIMLGKFFPKKIVQVILTTNSPFLISDIQGANILYLREMNIEKGILHKNRKLLGKTFGASVNALLLNNFFMEEGIIGFFAKEKINNIIKLLDKKGRVLSEEQGELKSLINIIGDTLVRKKLQIMYEEKVDNVDKIDKDIEYYLDIIHRLKKKKTYMKGNEN